MLTSVWEPLSSRQLCYYIKHIPHCQHFFSFFLLFFSTLSTLPRVPRLSRILFRFGILYVGFFYIFLFLALYLGGVNFGFFPVYGTHKCVPYDVNPICVRRTGIYPCRINDTKFWREHNMFPYKCNLKLCVYFQRRRPTFIIYYLLFIIYYLHNHKISLHHFVVPLPLGKGGKVATKSYLYPMLLHYTYYLPADFAAFSIDDRWSPLLSRFRLLRSLDSWIDFVIILKMSPKFWIYRCLLKDFCSWIGCII